MRNILCILLLLVLTFSLSQATVARVAGIAVDPIFLDDEVYLDKNPSTIPGFGNFVLFEQGCGAGDSNRYFAANYLLNKDFGLNVTINRKFAGISGISGEFLVDGVFRFAQPGGSLGNITAPGNDVTLGAGMKFGGLGLGLSVTKAQWGNDAELIERSPVGAPTVITTTTTERSSSLLGFGLGMNMGDPKGFAFDADAHVLVLSGSSSVDVSATPSSETQSNTAWDLSGGMAMSLNLRSQIAMTKQLSMIPVLGFGMASFGWKTASTVTSGGATTTNSVEFPGYSNTEIYGGIGMRYEVPEKARIWGQLLLDYSTMSEDDDTTRVNGGTTTHPAYVHSGSQSTVTVPVLALGAEVDVTSWLTARIGARKSIGIVKISSTYVSNGSPDLNGSETIPPADVYTAGLGFSFGKFTLDTQLDTEVLQSGTYLLSGRAMNPFVNVSLKYAF